MQLIIQPSSPTPHHNTYVHFDARVREDLGRRILERRVPIELQIAAIPFHRVQRDAAQIVRTVQLGGLAASHPRRLNGQDEIGAGGLWRTEFWW